ncbi:hypothetical protein [Micromonospora sp. NPDC049102]|uniref:hypothetical protein n=1 Tax=Micromonospora sp. NPDC049102 TaxID=3364265 RepID=UPI0037104833
MTGVVEPGMVLLADSDFYSFELFNRFAVTGADLIWHVGARRCQWAWCGGCPTGPTWR